MEERQVNASRAILPLGDIDAAYINAEHEAGERSERQALAHYLNAGRRLLAKKREILRGRSRGGWVAWLKANIRFTKQTANRYMRFAVAVGEGKTVFPSLADIWASTVTRTDAAQQLNPFGRNRNEEGQRKRTPPKLFGSLNAIFHFSVDSCAEAGNALVKKYWTEEDDCRRQDWTNERVWCNPPFDEARAIVPKATTAKLAVVLLWCNVLGTKWIRNALPRYVAIPHDRIDYLDAKGDKTGSSPMISILLLYGDVTDGHLDGLLRLNFLVCPVLSKDDPLLRPPPPSKELLRPGSRPYASR